MTRALPEWVAPSDDSAIPPRIKIRVFERALGLCEECTRRLRPGQWECDHRVPLIAGGRHAESNLRVICTSPCHKEKTRQDVAEKSRVYRKKASHLGVGPKRQKINSRGFAKGLPQRNASRPLNKWHGYS